MPGRNKNKLEDDRAPAPSLPSNGQNELDCRRLTRSSTEKRTNEVSQLEVNVLIISFSLYDEDLYV